MGRHCSEVGQTKQVVFTTREEKEWPLYNLKPILNFLQHGFCELKFSP